MEDFRFVERVNDGITKGFNLLTWYGGKDYLTKFAFLGFIKYEDKPLVLNILFVGLPWYIWALAGILYFFLTR
jgi:hypothetical protein